MAFKDLGKQRGRKRDTLYFNAFTEDLFYWDNDLENDSERVLKINTDSTLLRRVWTSWRWTTASVRCCNRYADFDFRIDYETSGKCSFSREVQNAARQSPKTVDNIKVSRGEENIFIWCFFLAIVQLALDGAEAYKWVKYIYIDDPISSLDEQQRHRRRDTIWRRC